jgi:aryl-alcohol dehydrogenase-like predicted oxidoreductase
MVSGLLSGTMTRDRIAKLPATDWRRRSADFQEPQLAHNLDLANLLAEIGFPHNVSAGIVAIAWALRNPVVTSAIIGLRNPQQVDDLILAAEFRLNDRELEQIDQFMNKPVHAHS